MIASYSVPTFVFYLLRVTVSVSGLAQHNVWLSTVIMLLIVVVAVGANVAMLRLSR